MPPTEYEKQYYQRLGSVQIIGGDSILGRFRNETRWEDGLSELWLISTQDDLVMSGKISAKVVRSASQRLNQAVWPQLDVIGFP